MLVSGVTSYRVQTYRNSAVVQKSFYTKNQSDVFIKSVNFCRNTSAGTPLRKLKNLTCPYTGIKMISGSLVGVFDKNLAKCHKAKDYVKLVSKYEKSLQPVEKKIFNVFKTFAKENPNGDFQKKLQEMYQNSLTKLKLEEFTVLDNVDALSRELSPETAFAIRKKTTKCRDVIIADDLDDRFKRKTFLTSLEEINPKEDEKEIFEKIKDQALFLPTSANSENAFVVKYAHRAQTEIARRLFIASTATIEHVTPNSKGGANAMENFLLTSANGNRARENMELTKYIERFPKIPEYLQIHINEIIKQIHKGALKGNETYPYKIKRKLEEESKGLIVLDLSKYKYTEEKAIQKVNEYKDAKKSKRGK